jgi:hypothetical protein
MIYLIGYFVIGLLVCYIQIQLIKNVEELEFWQLITILIFWLPLLVGWILFGIVYGVDKLFENIGEKILKVIKSLKL